MGSTSDKLTYLNDTKTLLRTNINAIGGDIDDDDTFRSYATELDNMWENLPHTTGSGTNISLNNTKKGKMKLSLKGNTSQTGTPTPSSPIPVNVVSGDNEVVVCGKNYFVKSSVIDGERYLNDGTISNDSSYCRSPLYMNVNGVNKLTISGSDSSSNGKVIIYDENKNVIDYWSTRNNTITIPNNSYYIRISVEKAYKDTLQVEAGDTATSYSSDSQTYPINLPVENLLNPVGTTTELNGMKLTNNGDGTFTIDGTASANTGIPLTNLVSYPITLKANQPYTQSAEIISGDLGDCTIVPAFKNSSDITTYNYFYCNKIKLTDTKTSTDTMTATNYNLYIASGGTATNCTFRVQLERGSKANSYTPYGTTPIELNKIGTYQDKFIRNSGKNLFNETNKLAGYYFENNGTIMSDGGPRNVLYYFKCKPSTAYSFSYSSYKNVSIINITTTTEQPQANVSVGDGSSITLANLKKENYITPSNAEYIVIRFQSTAGYYIATGEFADFITDFQAEENASATSYEPYGNGDLYLEKHIGKVVLDGSESNWEASGGATSLFQNTSIFNGKYLVQNAYCDYYKNVVDTSIVDNNSADTILGNGQFSFRMGSTKDRIYIKDTRYTIWSDLQTWLSTHNITIYYKLATPYLSLIEGTLKEQLEEVWRANTFDGQTNISQINNDLPLNLSVTALESEGE